MLLALAGFECVIKLFALVTRAGGLKTDIEVFLNWGTLHDGVWL